jgi:hypothetical protein
VADIALKIEPDSGLLTALLSGTAPNTIVVFRQTGYVPVAIRFDAPAGFSFRKAVGSPGRGGGIGVGGRDSLITVIGGSSWIGSGRLLRRVGW